MRSNMQTKPASAKKDEKRNSALKRGTTWLDAKSLVTL